MATSGAYRTQTDLVNEALKNLGVLAAGNAADPEDFNYVLERLDPMLRMLAALDICYVGDPNNIPGEQFAALSDCLAGECAAKFGSTPDDRIILVNKGVGGATPDVRVGDGVGARVLRQIGRGRPTFEVLRPLYL